MTRRHAACSGKTCLQLSARRSLAWLRRYLFTPIKGLPLQQRSTRAVYWRRLRSGVLNAGADGRCESLGPCLVGGTSVLGTGWRTGRIVVGPNECWKLTVARQGPPRRELMESTGPDRLSAERWCRDLASASTSGFNLSASRRQRLVPAVIGGFSIIDVPSHEEALAWGAKIAVGCRCAQEVREIMFDPLS